MGKFNQILITGEEMRKNSGRVWSVLRAGLAPSYKCDSFKTNFS